MLEQWWERHRGELTGYCDAFERHDVDRLVSLLHEDATMSMPPFTWWLRGREHIRRALLAPDAGCLGSRLVPVAANGSPAFAHYVPTGPGGAFEPRALMLLDVHAGRVTGTTSFLDTARPCAAIPISAPMREWGRVNALVPEIFAWLARQGIEPAGPLFYRYRVIGDMDVPFEVEVGVPVPRAVEGDGRVVAGSIPAGRYATLTHHGHPDGLFGSITALRRWAADRGVAWDIRREGGREVWGGCFEFYPTDPAVEPDMDQWSIELAYRVRDAR